ncbi:MAG: penicillin-binding protein 2 [Pseudomonadota bacterium]
MSGRADDLIPLLAAEDGAERVLSARAERRRKRAERRRRAAGDRAEFRLGLICFVFILAFGALAARMTQLAAAEPAEPAITTASADKSSAAGRRTITDAKGRVLATDLLTYSIYAQSTEMRRAGLTPADAARQLSAALPDLDEDALRAKLEKHKGFVWIKRPATPEQRQAAHDLGLPGVHTGRRETRIYPAGRIAAHIVGGVKIDSETVHEAVISGRSGVEKTLDAELRQTVEEPGPLALSLDLSVQTALTDELSGSMDEFGAIGGAATLLNVRTGEVVAMVSLPDFDPNNLPNPNDEAVKRDLRLINRAAQGLYELGSTYKLFTAAQALEQGHARLDTLVDTDGPIRMGKYAIGDFHRMPSLMSLADVIVESSNVGTSRLALQMGPEAQQEFLARMGLLAPTELELFEARTTSPRVNGRWGKLKAMTVSFGHGIASTQLHLAMAYATLVNGGLAIQPTLRLGGRQVGEQHRVISADTSRKIRGLLRTIVAEGTGRKAQAPGYEVGGKTGTADKPKAGGYHKDKTITTFASVFPASDPRYVLVLTLDEPETVVYGKRIRTAGWTAAPATGRAIRRIAPLLSMRPKTERRRGPEILTAGTD